MNDTMRKEIALYMERARKALRVAQLNADHDFYAASINRAYYAIFYAAKALLATEDVSRVKHSGVISAFRQHFVKPGTISPEFSEIYGQVMEDRHESDYDLITAISREDTQIDIDQAQRYVGTPYQYSSVS